MAIKLPKELEAELQRSITEAIERGKAARLRAILGSIIVLAASLAVFAAQIGVSEGF